MFNAEDYRHLKEVTIDHFIKKGLDKAKIVEYASLSGIPLTVIYTYIKEEFPEKGEFCDREIEKLRKFYGY